MAKKNRETAVPEAYGRPVPVQESREVRVLLMKGGKSYSVVGETGKYWLCEGTRFRKTNPAILTVKSAVVTPVVQMVRRDAPEAEEESHSGETDCHTSVRAGSQ